VHHSSAKRYVASRILVLCPDSADWDSAFCASGAFCAWAAHQVTLGALGNLVLLWIQSRYMQLSNPASYHDAVTGALCRKRDPKIAITLKTQRRSND